MPDVALVRQQVLSLLWESLKRDGQWPREDEVVLLLYPKGLRVEDVVKNTNGLYTIIGGSHTRVGATFAALRELPECRAVCEPVPAAMRFAAERWLEGPRKDSERIELPEAAFRPLWPTDESLRLYALIARHGTQNRWLEWCGSDGKSSVFRIHATILRYRTAQNWDDLERLRATMPHANSLDELRPEQREMLKRLFGHRLATGGSPLTRDIVVEYLDLGFVPELADALPEGLLLHEVRVDPANRVQLSAKALPVVDGDGRVRQAIADLARGTADLWRVHRAPEEISLAEISAHVAVPLDLARAAASFIEWEEWGHVVTVGDERVPVAIRPNSKCLSNADVTSYDSYLKRWPGRPRYSPWSGVSESLASAPNLGTTPLTLEAGAPPPLSDRKKVFLSHASEDKDTVAKPLKALLEARGYEVWLDEFELHVGDSLQESLDEGLSSCHHGVLILSEAFFRKPWPKAELHALTQRARGSAKGRVLLPVRHGISPERVSELSPLTGRLLSANTAVGMEKLADELARAIDSTDSDSGLPGGRAENRQRRLRSSWARIVVVGVAMVGLTLMGIFGFNLRGSAKENAPVVSPEQARRTALLNELLNRLADFGRVGPQRASDAAVREALALFDEPPTSAPTAPEFGGVPTLQLYEEYCRVAKTRCDVAPEALLIAVRKLRTHEWSMAKYRRGEQPDEFDPRASLRDVSEDYRLVRGVPLTLSLQALSNATSTGN